MKDSLRNYDTAKAALDNFIAKDKENAQEVSDEDDEGCRNCGLYDGECPECGASDYEETTLHGNDRSGS